MLDRLFRRGQHYPENKRQIDPEKTPEETQALIALSGRFIRNDAGRWVEKETRFIWNRVLGCIEDNPNAVTIKKAKFRRRGFAALVEKAAAEKDAAHESHLHRYDNLRAIKKRILETVAYYPGVYEKSGIFEKWIVTSLELDDLQGLQERLKSGKFNIESEKIAIRPGTGRFDPAGSYSSDTLSVTLVRFIYNTDSYDYSSRIQQDFLLHPTTNKLYYFPGNPHCWESPGDEEYKLSAEQEIAKIEKLMTGAESN